MFEKLTSKVVRVRSSRQEICYHILGGVLGLHLSKSFQKWVVSPPTSPNPSPGDPADVRAHFCSSTKASIPPGVYNRYRADVPQIKTMGSGRVKI